MIVSSVKPTAVLVLLLFLLGCSPVNLYMVQRDDKEKSFALIVQESLAELTGITTYSDSI
jgi:uncharacterized membrane protein